MRIPRVGVRNLHKKIGAKVYSFATNHSPKKTAKKIVPATMIVSQSLTGVAAPVQDLVQANFFNYKNYVTKNFSYVISPNINPRVAVLEYTLERYKPRNNFKKTSNCLREKYAGSVEDLNYFLEKLIPKRNGKKDYNPFYNKAEAFIKAGEKYNINPTVLIAIGMQESGRGTSRAAREMKNIGGIYLKNKHAHFEKVEDCIDIMASTINKRVNEQCTTIEQVGKSGKYCEKSASDIWIKNVMFYLNRM